MDKGKNKVMSSSNSDIKITTADWNSTTTTINRVIRILLYDADAQSSREISNLLHQCSTYPVKTVLCESEAINELNSSYGCEETDIILAEASLLLSASGSHLLSYITKSKHLKHIPVIMMLGEEDVSMIFKGLGLGATDYVMKPFGATEVLNLRIHIHKIKST